ICSGPLSEDPNPDLRPGPGRRPAFLLAGERDGPEAVGVAASGGALGVEADLAGGQDAALDGVDLADELAVAGQRDVFAHRWTSRPWSRAPWTSHGPRRKPSRWSWSSWSTG